MENYECLTVIAAGTVNIEFALRIKQRTNKIWSDKDE